MNDEPAPTAAKRARQVVVDDEEKTRREQEQNHATLEEASRGCHNIRTMLKVISHPSPLAPHSALRTPHPSLLTPHPSLLTPHSSILIHSTSLTPHSSARLFHQESCQCLTMLKHSRIGSYSSCRRSGVCLALTTRRLQKVARSSGYRVTESDERARSVIDRR